jgi:regulator of RNase E activity RraA
MLNRLWNSEEELFELMRRELFTAVVGDIMDQLSLFHQFLPPEVRPLRDDMVLAGKAMPVLEEDVTPDSFDESTEPSGLMLQALDDLKTNEVFLCSGASPRYALWGELMSTRAIRLGAAGAVLNGYTRDTAGIIKLGFPTFAFGSYAQDQRPRGRVLDYRLRLEIGSVWVETGDIVMGDVDGVCIVPLAAHEEILAKALEKVRGEKKVRGALEQGMSARDAFTKFGIM